VYSTAMAICFGYENRKYLDGSGAQVQRILSIRALANFLGTGFFNSEVLDIDFNPGDGIDTPHKKKIFLRKLNSFVTFPGACDFSNASVNSIPNNRLINHFFGLKIWTMIVKLTSTVSRSHKHFTIANPERWISQNPNILDEIDFHLNELEKGKSEKKFIVSLHIPRAKISDSRLTDRYQSTNWYKVLLDEILKTLSSAGVDYRIQLHTDAAEYPQSWNFEEGVSSKTLEYWRRGGFLDLTGETVLGHEDFFVTLGKTQRELEIYTGINALEAWKLMAKSNILVTGKSSFSFVGGLMATSALVITPNYFNRGLGSWLVLPDNLEGENLLELERRVLGCLD